MEFEQILAIVNLVLFFATLITAAVTDLLHHKIYNWTTGPALALGLALGYGMGGVGTWPSFVQPGVGLCDRLCGFALGFGLFFAINRSTGGKALGMGDVKFMAAIGGLTGFHFTLWAVFWGSLVGALFALWLVIWRGKLRHALRRSFAYATSLRTPPEGEEDVLVERIPYGVALSVGTFLAWFLIQFPAQVG